MPEPRTASPTPKAPGVRARVRAELTAEIKASARRQLALEGASALSLRAIAREMNMASSAIYRYFASRDELLTALIIDAYDSIGTAVEDADAELDRPDYAGRFRSIADTVRSWAHQNPHEYALIYGSPVPGYAAPPDTIDPAVRAPAALFALLADRYRSPSLNASEAQPAQTNDGADAVLATSLAPLAEFVDHQVPLHVLALGIRAWAEIFGLVSLELHGHFNDTVINPEAFYHYSISALIERTMTV